MATTFEPLNRIFFIKQEAITLSTVNLVYALISCLESHCSLLCFNYLKVGITTKHDAPYIAEKLTEFTNALTHLTMLPMFL